MTENCVDLVALGGLGEIGLNMMTVSSGQDMVVIDAGLMFPEEGMFGVDVVIPDFSYLIDRSDRVRAVVLTHGHEDHIGALPFLLKQINVPVYGTRLTLELLKVKLKEFQITEADLRLIAPRERIEIGPFGFEFIKVSHSILDGVALAIDTPAGRLVHSGDFKIEQSPACGDRFDFNKFAEVGGSGVRALFSDSTNVERTGFTISEQRIAHTFRDIFRNCTGRILVSCFASSLVRIQQVVDVAREFDRMVAFDGKSMIANVNIAKNLGLIDIPEEMQLPLGGVKSRPDNQVVLITTGSQGEPMSALARMAFNDHKKIKIKKGDTVILSSRFIPGNERAINHIINNLYRQGADVIYETVSEVHVSGHAYQEELKMMINLVQPEYFIPIHGEYRHLVKHGELARSVGIPAEKTLLVENGQVLRFDADGARVVEKIETGRVLVDGKGVGDIGQVVLNDRKHLAEHGMVVALVVIDAGTGEILSGPDIISKGFVFEDDTTMIEDAKCLILEAFDDIAETRGEDTSLPPDVDEIKSEIKRTLKRFFYKMLERRPVIIPEIIAL